MVAIEEEFFWFERFREHANLVNKLLRNNDPFQYLLDAWNNSNTIPMELIYETKNTFLDIFNGLDEDGNLFLSSEDFEELIAHMIEEMDYFLNLMEEKLTETMQIDFWLKESKEHLDFVVKLLNLSSLVIINPSKVQNFKNLLDGFSKLFNKYLTFEVTANLLQTFSEGINVLKKVRDAIPRETESDQIIYEMINHEINEAEFGQYKLDKLMPHF